MDYIIKIDDEAGIGTSKFEISGQKDCINIFLTLDEDEPENQDNFAHYQLSVSQVDDFVKALKRAKKDQQEIINRMKKIEKDDNKS